MFIPRSVASTSVTAHGRAWITDDTSPSAKRNTSANMIATR